MAEIRKLLQSIVVEPTLPATASIICLHGLGATNSNFSQILKLLNVDNLPIRFIFPQAPLRKITRNAGSEMPAWYDVYSLDRFSLEDEAGLKASALEIDAFVQVELDANIPANRIMLAGFSQGGAMALYCGLRYPQRLAGILSLSAYLPLHHQLKEAHPANRDVPILMAHGSLDAVVSLAFGKLSHLALKKEGYAVDWRTYTMQHELCPEELQDIAIWLRKWLNFRGI